MTVQPTQVWAVVPDRYYDLAIQFGPTFNGAAGGFLFDKGVLTPGPIRGSLIHSTSVGTLCAIWEHIDGFAPEWVGDSWAYVRKTAPKRVSLPPPEKDPTPRKSAKTKKSKARDRS